MTVLKIDSTVAARIHDKQLDVQSKVSVFFLRHNIRSAQIARPAAAGSSVITAVPPSTGIVHDLPLDGHRRFESPGLPSTSISDPAFLWSHPATFLRLQSAWLQHQHPRWRGVGNGGQD